MNAISRKVHKEIMYTSHLRANKTTQKIPLHKGDTESLDQYGW